MSIIRFLKIGLFLALSQPLHANTFPDWIAYASIKSQSSQSWVDSTYSRQNPKAWLQARTSTLTWWIDDNNGIPYASLKTQESSRPAQVELLVVETLRNRLLAQYPFLNFIPEEKWGSVFRVYFDPRNQSAKLHPIRLGPHVVDHTDLILTHAMEAGVPHFYREHRSQNETEGSIADRYFPLYLYLAISEELGLHSSIQAAHEKFDSLYEARYSTLDPKTLEITLSADQLLAMSDLGKVIETNEQALRSYVSSIKTAPLFDLTPEHLLAEFRIVDPTIDALIQTNQNSCHRIFLSQGSPVQE